MIFVLFWEICECNTQPSLKRTLNIAYISFIKASNSTVLYTVHNKDALHVPEIKLDPEIKLQRVTTIAAKIENYVKFAESSCCRKLVELIGILETKTLTAAQSSNNFELTISARQAYIITVTTGRLIRLKHIQLIVRFNMRARAHNEEIKIKPDCVTKQLPGPIRRKQLASHRCALRQIGYAYVAAKRREAKVPWSIYSI